MNKFYVHPKRYRIKPFVKFLVLLKFTFLIVLTSCFNLFADISSKEKKSPDTKNGAMEAVHHRISLNTKETNIRLDRIVKGVVKDSSGLTLQGVNIMVKGTAIRTVTDANGRFSISIPENAKLVFSLVGFVSTEKAVGEEKDLIVVMYASTNILDDVVIVGYGTSTKRKLNSAISTLNMESVASLPVASINDAIAGRLQGVIVTSSSGAPGAKSSISIRGGATPLYVIDNQIRSLNDFENLNPNDIDSYSVLKDVGATALYGQLGANGIILVTTKKGNVDKLAINYSFNEVFSQPTLYPQHLSSYRTLSAINKVYIAEGKTQPTTDADLELYRNQTMPYQYPNTDWRSLALKDFSTDQRHDLSISSGNRLLTYYASGSFYNQGSNLRTDNNSNKRITYRLNTVSNFDKINLKVTTGLDGFVENNILPISNSVSSYGAIYQLIQQQKPYNLASNEFGLPYNLEGNLLMTLSPLAGYNLNSNKVFNSLLSMEYDAPFLKGLGFKLSGNYNIFNTKGKTWNLRAPGYALNSTTPIYGPAPTLTARSGDGSTLNLQGFVTYNHKFGDHAIDFTGVVEQAQSWSSTLSASRRNYQIIFDQFVAGPTVDQSADGSEAESARAGYIGRLSYNYKSKYSVEGIIRYDGNDAFPIGKQWGTFYSLTAGYILSDESFMKSLKDKHILDYLKIRGSYGVVGNIDGAGKALYTPGYIVNANRWVINGNLVQGTSEPTSLPSTNFSWFNNNERNIGIDLATFKNKLSASIDYFYKRTTGFVTGDTRYAATLGIGLPPINFDAGATRREGMEFNLTWNDRKTDFSYKVSANFTYFNSLVERQPGELEAALKDPYGRVSGNTTEALTKGFYSLGYYGNNADLLRGPRRIASINTVGGDLRYEDTNGDGKLDAGDYRRIGSNPFPRINYGLTLDLGYKGFFFNTVIMGSGNRDRYLGDVVRGTSIQGILIYDFQEDYWRPDNQNAMFPRQTSTPSLNGGNNSVESDFWLLKSAFLRLKYIQLGYDFKAGLLSKSPLKNCKIFISGTNLLTSSKSKAYFIDPESSETNMNYPIQRTIAVGATIGF